MFVPRRCCTIQGEFSVPYAAHDIFNQRQKLKEQREHVLLVVKSYNSEQEQRDYDTFLSAASSLLFWGVLKRRTVVTLTKRSRFFPGESYDTLVSRQGFIENWQRVEVTESSMLSEVLIDLDNVELLAFPSTPPKFGGV